jgi:hypothetical protein
MEDARNETVEVEASRLGPAAGAAVVGAAVLGAATIWGAAGAAVMAGTMYDLLRKRPPTTTAMGEGAQRLSSSVLVRMARSVVGPRSVGFMVIRATDTATAAYFAYRVLAKELAKRRRLPDLPPPPAELPPEARAELQELRIEPAIEPGATTTTESAPPSRPGSSTREGS